MSKKQTILFLILLVFVVHKGLGQIVSDSCFHVAPSQNKLAVASNVVPGSIVVKDANGLLLGVELDTLTNQLILPQNKGQITICWRKLNLSRQMPKRLYATKAPMDTAFNKEAMPYYWGNPIPEESLFDTPELHKSGSIVRGVTGGNNSSASVNSSMNINLEGKLTEGLNIRANLTDQNVPFQPEGNTQQLQDFDNIYIELYNEKFSIAAGNLVFENKNNHFLRYYKNVEGAQLNLFQKEKGGTSLGIAGARGKFASVPVAAIDGVNGPYKVPGPDGNRFVVILINSEKVFLDGRLLQRGFEKDYTINYDFGEITFNSQILITRYSRIKVDFEYSEKAYARTTLVGKQSFKGEKLSFGIRAYSEKDNKNKPLNQQLSTEEIEVLRNAGDSLQLAWSDAYDSVAYNSAEVLYKKVYTSADGFYFKHSTSPDSAFFRVAFSQVGANKGDYKFIQASPVGRVYEFVAPINGVHQGDFVPYRLLTAPNKKQMVAAEFKIEDKGWVLTSELAVSSDDKNLYSNLNSEDDIGVAVHMRVEKLLNTKVLGQYNLTPYVGIEWVGENFSPIDRYRPIEYDRNWNALGNNRYSDQILKAGFTLEDKGEYLQYEFEHRDNQSRTQGTHHSLGVNKNIGPTRLKLFGEHYVTSFNQNHATWNKLDAEFGLGKGNLLPGVYYKMDKNQQFSHLSQELFASNNYFDEYGAFIKFKKTEDNKTAGEIRYARRADKVPVSGQLEDFTEYDLIYTNLAHQFNPHNQIEFVGNFRNNFETNTNENRNYINGRVVWNAQLLKRNLKQSLLYGISNSRELKREYVFIEVPVGQGTHVWRDLNEDGIKDFEEFFEALLPDERKYVKVFSPTDTYAEAFENTFNYRVNIRAPKEWASSTGLKKTMSHVDLVVSWRSIIKTTDEQLGSRLVPFLIKMDPDKLINQKTIFRSNLFLFKRKTLFGSELGFNRYDQKFLQTNGFDSRTKINGFVKMRWKVQQNQRVDVAIFQTAQENRSDYIANRNFDILAMGVRPGITFQPGTKWRTSVQYGYKQKKGNELGENEQECNIQEATVEFQISKSESRSLLSNFSYKHIQYNENPNTALAYEMLEAFQPGNNYTWNVSLTQRLIRGLNVIMTYNGRKSNNSNVVHFGNVSVSAIF